MNIACAYPNCQNPVIGQCVGLSGKPCKRYYCQIHSTGSLCYQCAEEKIRDEEYVYILQEFAGISDKILRKGKKKYLFDYYLKFGLSAFILLVIYVISINIFPDSQETFGMIMLGYAAVGGAISSQIFKKMRNKYELKLAEEVAEAFRTQDLDFINFFRMYRTEKAGEQKQKALRVAGAIGLLAFGIVAGISRESYRQDFLREVKSINRKLDNL